MDDRMLVERLRAQEPGALDELTQAHGPLLRYIIRGILDDPREREECLADVQMRVWARIGEFDPARGPFLPWLSAVARNLARNRRRRLLRRDEGAELDPAMADPTPGPEELVLRQERAARIQRAVAQLPVMERGLFYRKYYYLQSTAQMAAELGLTERGVEGRLRRLRLKLRRELGGELDE